MADPTVFLEVSAPWVAAAIACLGWWRSRSKDETKKREDEQKREAERDEMKHEVLGRPARDGFPAKPALSVLIEANTDAIKKLDGKIEAHIRAHGRGGRTG